MDVVFVESSLFERRRAELIDDETYRLVQYSLIQDPNLGDVIQGTGGLRKLRVSLKGRGKRGGGRVIYYNYNARKQIYFLLIYAKNEYSDLTSDQKKRLRLFVEDWKSDKK